MSMTFTEARAELARLFPGRYRAMYYTLTEQEGNGLAFNVECRIYVESGISTEGRPTWEDALAEIRVNTGIDSPKVATAEGAPE
jgi:hypothetical protein